jgi:uncharacterized phiE125 gp8 family phage protein
MIVWPPKQAGSVLDYEFDWSEALASGETISGDPAVTYSGVTEHQDPALANDDTAVQVWLEGGTNGTVAKVTCTITTSGGRTDSELAVVEIGGEVIGLAQAKAAQKIESDDEDDVLSGFLRGSIGHIERITGKKLRPKVVSETLDGFPVSAHDMRYPRGPRPIWLLYGPASEILSIEYDDTDGVTQTLDDFRLVAGTSGKLLPAYGSCWPCTACGEGTVRISYVAGYDATELPPELPLAALLLFGHFNNNREAVALTSGSVAAAKASVSGTFSGSNDLGNPFRVSPSCSSSRSPTAPVPTRPTTSSPTSGRSTPRHPRTSTLSGVLANALGASLAFTAVKAILIVADAANVNNVVVGGAASNAFALFGDATDTIAIKPGGAFMIVDPSAAGMRSPRAPATS